MSSSSVLCVLDFRGRSSGNGFDTTACVSLAVVHRLHVQGDDLFFDKRQKTVYRSKSHMARLGATSLKADRTGERRLK